MVNPVSLSKLEGRVVFNQTGVSMVGFPAYTDNVEETLCCNTAEGFDHLLQRGFAVFDSEEAMFRYIEDCHIKLPKSKDTRSSYFSAQWLKQAENSEFSWAKPHHILHGRCTALSSFAQQLHAILKSSSNPHSSSLTDSDIFSHANENYAGVIAVSGPIRRGQSVNSPNVYSLHQDPCFFTSLVERDAADRSYHQAPEKSHTDCGSEYQYSMEEKVVQSYKHSIEDVTVRQVNFWLPNQSNGNKYLVFLSREASAVITKYSKSSNSDDIMTVQTPSGNHWITNRGLQYIKSAMPDHVFLTNRPVIFVSSNEKEPKDALYHCGAVILGDDYGHQSNEEDHGSTEIRVAVFSKKKK
eukprot:CAMPEP_0113300904 /NCGR_PEP_ID=MMETSP0010_2-20120614/2339_1 /TAXON_ID=216773 ORGANISM="Corethron hystrix, Strain 308" /NCGR_SAMPLE_ID=MMETSP0010_2 /ASSEMBLY_ACC=CAM_ASM_000155 /LENGTH=353 /DNA_ID=CAMNT_0000154405 /DNA_START=238 /DNA_END=1299 /DNA_ORIENTATION=- /assembly_acc=CAM_ASM_000155